MAGTESGESATLEYTPTWAVAVVCFILVSVSILIEHGLHLLAKYLHRKRKTSLLHALNKIKSGINIHRNHYFTLLSITGIPQLSICKRCNIGKWQQSYILFVSRFAAFGIHFFVSDCGSEANFKNMHP